MSPVPAIRICPYCGKLDPALRDEEGWNVPAEWTCLPGPNACAAWKVIGISRNGGPLLRLASEGSRQHG